MTAFEIHSSPSLVSDSAESSAPARFVLGIDVATRLLDLLCSDDEFRARFELQPRAALQELGYQTPAAQLGVFGLDPVMNFCHFEGGLASKEVLTAAREQLLERGVGGRGGAPFGPFVLCG